MKPNNNNSTILLKFKIFVEFLITFCAIYLIVNFPLTFFMDVVIGFSAIFVLMQALGNIDKLNGYGKYNKPQPPYDNHDYHQETTDTYPHEIEPEPTYPDDNITDNNELPDMNDNSDFLIDNTSDFNSMDDIME